MNTDDISYIKEVLQRIREADTGFRVFGSDGHRYSLGAPLSECELLAFEQKHGISLPADYRFFLKEVGDGAAWRNRGRNRSIAGNAGAGPEYGLLPLEETVDDCDPGRPFPLIPLPTSAQKQEIAGPEEWADKDQYPGLLWISYMGCSFPTFLVVNGPAYGTVWGSDLEPAHFYFYPTGLTFGEWYRRWLDRLVDRAIPILAREELAKQVTEGMTVEDVVRICGGDWQQSSYGDGLRHMRCDQFATKFEIDPDDRVTWIFRHSISA